MLNWKSINIFYILNDTGHFSTKGNALCRLGDRINFDMLEFLMRNESFRGFNICIKGALFIHFSAT
jgi:hypothetical protein